MDPSPPRPPKNLTVHLWVQPLVKPKLFTKQQKLYWFNKTSLKDSSPATETKTMLLNNQSLIARLKHLSKPESRMLNWLRHQVSNNVISSTFVKTTKQISDPLTKPSGPLATLRVYQFYMTNTQSNSSCRIRISTTNSKTNITTRSTGPCHHHQRIPSSVIRNTNWPQPSKSIHHQPKTIFKIPQQKLNQRTILLRSIFTSTIKINTNITKYTISKSDSNTSKTTNKSINVKNTTN